MAEPAFIILDLSRLLSRVLHATPTGVDRVEMAYARELLARYGDRLHFAAIHPAGRYGRLPRQRVLRFLDETEKRWNHQGHIDRWRLRLTAVQHLVRLWPQRPPRRDPAARPVYIQVSPNHLVDRAKIETKLSRENARFICLVHDLIPIEYPEYARVSGAYLHRLRMENVASLAQGVLTNSAATAQSLERFIGAARRRPVIRASRLGTRQFHAREGGTEAVAPTKPYFLMIGTIEPRKNHILLLNVWRRMVAEIGHDATPRLVIVGRRGWENENVVDMLERCEALHGHVFEHAGLSDQAIEQLMDGASALLMPSFAEGFGMPVTEALAAGVPVICSDLPALREASDDIAEYLDPLDGPAWMAMIQDYAQTGSQRRADQLARMADWQAPSWDDHMNAVSALIDEVG